mmetsp:Transcript_11551/g.20479  ORF Transcript_11551/g.20479 Transcript_11551/m.20479 type:complete len:212 (-) Transcript_11551:567-1202(-)
MIPRSPRLRSTENLLSFEVYMFMVMSSLLRSGTHGLPKVPISQPALLSPSSRIHLHWLPLGSVMPSQMSLKIRQDLYDFSGVGLNGSSRASQGIQRSSTLLNETHSGSPKHTQLLQHSTSSARCLKLIENSHLSLEDRVEQSSPRVSLQYAPPSSKRRHLSSFSTLRTSRAQHGSHSPKPKVFAPAEHRPGASPVIVAAPPHSPSTSPDCK